MAFDGIVTKKVTEELENIQNYKIDKIYQPDKNTVILGLYGNFANVMLLSCISSNNYRIHLTTHTIKNPTVAPNFCMLLRKHILGYKITKIYTNALERVVFINMQNAENPEKVINKTLIVELMGKHSNVILTDQNGIIIDSLRHTSVEEKAQRDIYPTARYFQPITNKYNLLDVKNFEEFYSLLNLTDDCDIIKKVVDTFNGIGLSNIKQIAKTIEQEKSQYTSQKHIAHRIYDKIMEVLGSQNLTIEVTSAKKNIPNDYCLSTKNEKQNTFSLNFALDDFYFQKESNEIYVNFRNTLLNIILATLKKYEKRLENIDDKLQECKGMDKYKLYGELITANLYKIPNYNISSICLENYYDNNKEIEIKLDKKYSPQYNAKRFYKKYTKLKNALEIVGNQKQETINEIRYIESIVYELDNCKNMEDVQDVYNEIIENDIFKDMLSRKKSTKNKNYKKGKKMTTNKFVSFNPLKYNIDGYTIYVGRNNKENDYLTNKFANKNDIWLHTKDIHGSHVIIKSIKNENINKERENNTLVQTSKSKITKNRSIKSEEKEEINDMFLEGVPKNIIIEAAKLAVMHSKAKNSSNVPVDYCLVQFVKKLPGNKPGLVIYRNNKTIYV